MAMIDELIEEVKGQGMPDVAAVLAFTRAHGTDATLRLLAAADRHANAGLLRRLRTEGLLDEAVAKIKDGPWANDERPWLAREMELARHRRRARTGPQAVPCAK